MKMEQEKQEEFFCSKIGDNLRIELNFSSKEKGYELILPSTFKNIKITCNICYIELKDKDKIYFCPKKRIFMCRNCCINTEKDEHKETFIHKYSKENSDNHEDFLVIPVIEKEIN